MRLEAKLAGKYDVADACMEELDGSFSVFVNEKVRGWRAVPLEKSAPLDLIAANKCQSIEEFPYCIGWVVGASAPLAAHAAWWGWWDRKHGD